LVFAPNILTWDLDRWVPVKAPEAKLKEGPEGEGAFIGTLARILNENLSGRGFGESRSEARKALRRRVITPKNPA